MNKRVLGVGLVTLLVFAGLLYLIVGDMYAPKQPITIGILIPMEHQALREIVAGFEEKVHAHYPQATFNVQSAQGDLKLQRSILELFVGRKVDMIVPIGTTATQMTVSLVKQQPIVGLAAQFTEADRQKLNPRNMTVVLDEIGGKKKVDFIKAIMPDTRMITLITHSGNEKNFAEVAEIKTYARTLGIQVQNIAIQNLPDLETAGRSIEKESGAILILKDHLLASGIPLLVPLAKAQHIPLIASDEGSVQEGANFALGVRERMIGEEGGELAALILSGHAVAELPVQEMKKLAVFYNPETSKELKVKPEALKKFAEKNAYEFVENGAKKAKE